MAAPSRPIISIGPSAPQESRPSTDQHGPEQQQQQQPLFEDSAAQLLSFEEAAERLLQLDEAAGQLPSSDAAATHLLPDADEIMHPPPDADTSHAGRVLAAAPWHSQGASVTSGPLTAIGTFKLLVSIARKQARAVGTAYSQEGVVGTASVPALLQQITPVLQHLSLHQLREMALAVAAMQYHHHQQQQHRQQQQQQQEQGRLLAQPPSAGHSGEAGSWEEAAVIPADFAESLVWQVSCHSSC